MTALRDRLVDVLTELVRIQADSSVLGDSFPDLVYAGDGSLLVSAKIEKEIAEVARMLMSNDPEIARQFSVAK